VAHCTEICVHFFSQNQPVVNKRIINYSILDLSLPTNNYLSHPFADTLAKASFLLLKSFGYLFTKGGGSVQQQTGCFIGAIFLGKRTIE